MNGDLAKRKFCFYIAKVRKTELMILLRNQRLKKNY